MQDAAEVIRKIAIRIAVLISLIFLLLVAGLMWARRSTPPAIARMKAEPQTTKVSDLTGEQLAELFQLYDPDFYTHKGYSLHSTGFRSITQRLVEQYYFTDYQAWLEMAPGTIDAWVLNREMTKDEQLHVFLNTAQFGTSHEHPVRGFQEAAEAFFQKKFSELNQDEYLSILSMLADPDKYHIQAEALANIERTNRVKKFLNGKCKANSITDVELKNCR
jgi:membrane carboxypeptidase/penicillin-binding protein